MRFRLENKTVVVNVPFSVVPAPRAIVLHVQANTIIMTMEWNGITLAKIASIVDLSIVHNNNYGSRRNRLRFPQ